MPICITGMHRTGTSMVARLLNICGIYLGKESDLIGPEPDNPEGFWENRHFVSINDEILAKLGGAWDLPPPDIKRWEKRHDLIPLKNKASNLIEEFIGHEPWGWKDPRNSLTVPFWTSILPDLRFVICVRNPVEVYRSLHKRGYSSNAFAFKLWLIYNQRLLADTIPEQRIISHYESYFINPEEELRRILDFLELSVSGETIEHACSTISHSLRHHSIDSSTLNKENVPSELIKLYKKICANEKNYLEPDSGHNLRYLEEIKQFTDTINQEDIKEDHKVRAIAFYLPQFYPIPENDEWWGKDFTDWVNVSKATPLFPGHYQPRIPADLGYYDLRIPEIREAQANLAREYGIHGFCYYHYWFNGKLLLESPLHEVLNSGKPDFPFCLCWANEDWTRAWDGRSGEILIKQDYTEDDDLKHIRYLSKFFHDKRYIRINGKPLFLVYRANKMPDPFKTTTIWREEARRLDIGELYLCRVESFPDEHTDPTLIGFDTAVEFQPDWSELTSKLAHQEYDDHIIYEYEDIVECMLKKIKPDYKHFPCVNPTWDNSPRRKSNAYIFIDSSPQIYERWLRETIRNFKIYSPGENFIFINAWNEWGESNYLEPDLKFGKAYLEATKNVLLNSTSELEKTIVSLKEEDFSPSVLVKIGKLCNSLEFNNHAKYFFDKALQLDPDNEDAKANLAILSDKNIEELDMPLPIAIQDNLSIIKVASCESYKKYISNIGFEYSQREQYERSLIKDSKPFSVEGYCYVCDQEVKFSVDYKYSCEINGVLTPNWRERLVCPICGLNNRMRASIHLFEQILKPERKESKVYITEQVSPVYNWLKKNYANVAGSEYLGESILFGTTNSKGIRNEKLTKLSFSNNQFDYILSFDVFEHIPNFKKAFQECFRVLKSNGALFFTVPFAANSEKNITRAIVKTTGEIEHLLPPDIHGNPVDPRGCLAYYYFGWEILEQLKETGFDSASAYFYWSKEFGYLGGEQIVFIAEK